MEQQIRQRIASTERPNKMHTAFTCIFEYRNKKRKDGKKVRKLTGRLGVEKDITGKGQPYNPGDYDLLTVYEQQRDGGKFTPGDSTNYRNIPLDGIRVLRVNGQTYTYGDTEIREVTGKRGGVKRIAVIKLEDGTVEEVSL